MSPIEHTSALKILRPKAQCLTRLRPNIRGVNTLDHTNVNLPPYINTIINYCYLVVSLISLFL